jgi:biopolymer transport protein ExbB
MAGLLFAGAALGAGPDANTSSLEAILSGKDETQKTEMEGVEQGDMREFGVNTDDDITALNTGDIYKSNGTFFKVTGLKSKGKDGGKFVMQRIAGKTDPAQKWNRVSGMGPLTIAATQTLLDLYVAGGVFMHPIAVLALAMILLASNSIWIYRRGRQIPGAFVDSARRFLDAGDLAGFEDLSLRQRGLFPSICRAITDRFQTSSPDDIQYRCEINAGAEINRLRIPVKAMNLIAGAAPLLGLLGTIVGMVMVFEAVAGASGASKAQALAAGIRVKLFCTAAALCVAIPALFLFFFFNQKLGVIISECEVLTEQFIHKVTQLKLRGASAGAGLVPAGEQDPANSRQAARAAREGGA